MNKIILIEPVLDYCVCDIKRYVRSSGKTHYHVPLVDSGLADDYTNKERRVHEDNVFAILDEKHVDLAKSFNAKMKNLHIKLSEDKKKLIEEFKTAIGEL